MTPFTVLQLSDLHILPNIGELMLGFDTFYYFERTLQHAYQFHGPFDLILLTGDLAQEPCESSYQRIANCLQAYQTPCVYLPGNHDDFGIMTKVFGKAMGCGQAIMLGCWQILCLNTQKPDSPAGRLDQRELIFLEQNLEMHPESPALIAMHHPCVASGAAWLDTMQIENSDALLAIVNRFTQIKALVCGHLHQELEQSIGSTTLYATPSTCFQFTPGAESFSLDTLSPGYRILELRDHGQLQSHCHRIPETMTIAAGQYQHY